MIKNEYLESLKGDDNVLYIYHYGNNIYELPSNELYIFIVILSDNTISENYNSEFKNCVFTYYRMSDWYRMLFNNDLRTFICGVLPKKYIVKEFVKLRPKVDKIKLSSEVSNYTNTYKKDIKRPFLDYSYSNKCYLFKLIQTLLFGIQIAKYGYIGNLLEANFWYKKIYNENFDDFQKCLDYIDILNEEFKNIIYSAKIKKINNENNSTARSAR